MANMSFVDFKNEVVNKIREFLPDSFQSADVSLQIVNKNNQTRLTGLIIKGVESNIAPTIYLEQFYHEFEDGASMDSILADIAAIRMRNDFENNFDISEITDFANCKDRIIPKLVGADLNRNNLDERPHRFVEDLAITYVIALEDFGSDDGLASIAIANNLIEMWGIPEEQLFNLAVSNMKRICPATFRSLAEVMAEMMGVTIEELEEMGLAEVDNMMYVLSNPEKINGASALLDKEMMDSISERFADGFYIIPSSIHECLIVPVSSAFDTNTIKHMISEVNTNNVEPEDRLSYSVYTYTIKDGLRIAE